MEVLVQFISENLTMIYILVFIIFLGTEVISNVPTVLHTPLMSGAECNWGCSGYRGGFVDQAGQC